MKNQYLLIAESILYKNNKLTAINIYDQLMAVKLPAEFIFDMAILCGPGWTPGDYDLDIFVRIKENIEKKLGSIKINIPNENFVYNAIAPELSLGINEDIVKVSFIVKSGDKLILERDFKVNTLAEKTSHEENSVI